MSDPITTHVHDAQGPISTGSGDQFLFNLTVALGDKGRQARNPRAYAEAQLSWLQARFINPRGFTGALGTLRREGVVLLNAAPGSGRSATALMLLSALPGHPEAAIRELAPDIPARPDEQSFDLDAVGDYARLLVDLSPAGEGLWSAAHDDLSSLCKTVKDRSAHLVVVLPHRRAERLRMDLIQYQADIGAPNRRHVLQRHLRQAGIPADETAETPAALDDFLRMDRPMREVAELASLIARVRTDSQDKGGFLEWSAKALSAVTDRTTQVAQILTKLRHGPDRALLVSTAMLHGAPADTVHQAAALLVRTTRYPQDETPVLEHADLTERLGGIDAAIDTGGGVHFNKLGYDTAIRGFVWDHMPQLRTHLGTWVGDAVDLPDLSGDVGDDFVLRFTDLCLRGDRHLNPLVHLVTRWTRSPAPSNRLRATALLLTRGLQHQLHGRYFTKQTYQWSVDIGLPRGLAHVLVEVCSTVMPLRYPDEAMVRLHHLARRQPQSQARQRLLDLVLGDRRLHRRMLDRLARAPEDKPWSADSDLFLELAAPVRLIEPAPSGRPLLTERGMPARLAAGWRRVFLHHLQQAKGPRLPVQDWLDAARDDATHRDLLLSILVTATAADPPLAGRLYVTVRDWASRPGELYDLQAVVSNGVLEEINTAQDAQRPL